MVLNKSYDSEIRSVKWYSLLKDESNSIKMVEDKTSINRFNCKYKQIIKLQLNQFFIQQSFKIYYFYCLVIDSLRITFLLKSLMPSLSRGYERLNERLFLFSAVYDADYEQNTLMNAAFSLKTQRLKNIN